jgi:WD40 repeat protein
VALSPDGRTALTGSFDQTARLWDTATGKLRRELHHPYPVWTVAFSPDGKRILTGSGPPDRFEGEARMWDARTGQLLHRLRHPMPVDRVAFSPDGGRFLTVGPIVVGLGKTSDGNLIAQLPHPVPDRPLEHVDPKMTAAFSPDGKLIATGGQDGTVRLWDAVTGESRGKPFRASSPVLALAFSPNSQTFVTGTFDGRAQLWDVATGKPHGPVLQHRGPVKAVAFSHDGSMVATGGTVMQVAKAIGLHRVDGGEARLWAAATGEPLGPPLQHPGPVWSVAFSRRDSLLVTGAEDSHLRLFLTATGAPVGKPLAHTGLVRCVVISSDGSLALAASSGGGPQTAKLWLLPDERSLARLLLQPGNLRCLAFSPRGRALLTGTDDRTARLWDLSTGGLTAPALCHGPVVLPDRTKADPNQIVAVGFSSNGHLMLTASEDGSVRFWDRTNRLRWQFQTATWISSIAWGPDDRTMLVCDHDGLARIWDAATARCLDPPLGAQGWPGGIAAISPDGTTLLTANANGAWLWDRQTHRRLHHWPRSPNLAFALFYPDGKKVLAVAGGSAHIWDVSTGQVTGAPAFRLQDGIGKAAFSPDGRCILITGTDEVGRLWDVETGQVIGPRLSAAGARPVSFDAAGRLLAVGGPEGRVTVWPVLPPLEGNVEHIRLRLEALTGLELDEKGGIRDLSPTESRQRLNRLGELGNPFEKLERR